MVKLITPEEWMLLLSLGGAQAAAFARREWRKLRDEESV